MPEVWLIAPADSVRRLLCSHNSGRTIVSYYNPIMLGKGNEISFSI